jgi:hypothetical protein
MADCLSVNPPYSVDSQPAYGHLIFYCEVFVKKIALICIVCLFSGISFASGKYTSQNGYFVVPDVNVDDKDFYDMVTVQFNFTKGTFKIVNAKPQGPQSVKDAFFYIKDAKIVGGKLWISGDYITPNTIEMNTSGGSSSSSTPPPITITGRFQVKWILPPKIGDLTIYNAVKGAAEGAGYETVEHNDFSYP